MAVPVEDGAVRQAALLYVIALYDELTEENGAPTLGSQNQAVDFILADPELCRAVFEWAVHAQAFEAHAAPPQRLRQDWVYQRVRPFLDEALPPPGFASPPRPPR
jgi:hypothetical protein